ncbi:MAG TPA: Ni/Fe-hydrogenase, b-type cytochrome subunit [Nitrospirae bacterium]|nr:Ni/Fe-hydrogenase, b-type cytochrome subunit [Nitrospirota bacterium]
MAQIHISPQKKALVYTRNFTNRLIHWTTFFSVITLLITGYYIGEPTAVYGQGEAYNTFVMADIRYYHFIAAMVLDVSLMVWFYLAFFSMSHRYWRQMLPTPKNIKEAMEVKKSYFTFKKPKFYSHFDPFDGLLFLALILFMVMQMVTGFQLYVEGLPQNYWWAQIIHLATDWVEWVFGSHQNVRLVHHLMEWIMVSGIIVHIYLQVTKTIIWQDGHIGQMVGGYKYKDIK